MEKPGTKVRHSWDCNVRVERTVASRWAALGREEIFSRYVPPARGKEILLRNAIERGNQRFPAIDAPLRGTIEKTFRLSPTLSFQNLKFSFCSA
jgi:hypothetical protein